MRALFFSREMAKNLRERIAYLCARAKWVNAKKAAEAAPKFKS